MDFDSQEFYMGFTGYLQRNDFAFAAIMQIVESVFYLFLSQCERL